MVKSPTIKTIYMKIYNGKQDKLFLKKMKF